MRQHVVSMFGHTEILHTHTLFGPETLEEDETACSVYVRTQGNTPHTVRNCSAAFAADVPCPGDPYFP